MNNDIASNVLWRRLGYMLTPQLDIYHHLAQHLMGARVLEVGFGTGFGVLQYARCAWRVDALEVDKAAVAFAKKCIPLKNVSWMTGDICNTTPDYAIYDAVVMIEVLEHIENWEAALENIKVLLKTGGVFYMSARNANADLRKNDLHEREWNAEELDRYLNIYFRKVELYDYRLFKKQSIDTTSTPLMAKAEK